MSRSRTWSRPARRSCSPTATARRSATCSMKNQLAADVVPPVPLDWCGAQTQATIGIARSSTRCDGPGRAGRRPAGGGGGDPHARGRRRPGLPATRSSRSAATSPRREADRFEELGQTWRPVRRKGWRRVVASPEPLEILDAPAVAALLAAGFVVVAAGGGGVPGGPRRRRAAARSRGRDRQGPGRRAAGARRRARTTLVIATDVPHAVRRVRHARGPAHRPRHRRPSCAAARRRGISPAAAWARRSRPTCGSSSRAASAAVITSLEHIGAAVAGRPAPWCDSERSTTRLKGGRDAGPDRGTQGRHRERHRRLRAGPADRRRRDRGATGCSR